MNRIARFSAVAASAGAAALLLSFTSAGPAVAQTFKPVMAMIINGTDNPVPVIDVGAVPPAIEEPFQHLVSSFAPATLSFQVPDGKRLVIEFYSGTAATQVPCATAAMTISTDVGEGRLQHRVLAMPVAQGQPSDFNQYTVSQQVRLYAAPGSLVQVAASTVPTCAASFLGVLSGFLVDVS